MIDRGRRDHLPVGSHRGHVGGALLGAFFLCLVTAVPVATAKASGWADPYAIGLLVVGVLCLLGALVAFEASGIIAHPLMSAARRMTARLRRLRSIPSVAARWSPIVVSWRGFPPRTAPLVVRGAPIVIRALYGAGEQWADVTNLVRNLVNSGRPFKADNETLMGAAIPP
ncbi:MAG: hypothetical protein ACRET5_01840 [Steroidobacteraceae bacterium]